MRQPLYSRLAKHISGSSQAVRVGTLILVVVCGLKTSWVNGKLQLTSRQVTAVQEPISVRTRERTIATRVKATLY